MDWDFWFKPSQNDISQGQVGLKYFNNASVSYLAYKGYNLNSLIAKLADDESDFLGRFGFEIKKSGITDPQLKTYMESLAKKSRGLIPNAATFRNMISGIYQDLGYLTDFSDNYPTATGEFIEQTQSDVKAVSDFGFDTLKSIGTIGPIVIIGGLLIISWSYIQKFKAS